MRAFWVVGAIAVGLAGCGPIERANLRAKQDAAVAQQKQWVESSKAETAKAKAYCVSLSETKDLDPIRGKVELSRYFDDQSSVPFEILSNGSYPTPLEKVAISKWGVIRDKCNSYVQELRQKLGPPPSDVLVDAWNRTTSFSSQEVEAVSELTIGLYEGKLTYGDFAKRRKQVVDDTRNAVLSYLEAMKEADYQRRMQAADLAVKQYEARIQEQQNWVRVMGIGAGMMQGGVGGTAPGTNRIMCTNNPMAGGTIPNSTICQNF